MENLAHRCRVVLAAGGLALAVTVGSYGITVAQEAQNTISPPPAAARVERDSEGLQEVVVTAQKRSENLQNVPVAVSAIGAEELSQGGVNSVTDLRIAVPTLNLVNSAGYLNTSLRGVGSNGIGPGIENPVALYIDGVYYASAASSLLTLNDISQVEVLKGPQGTLFGRNATGGLIQITTRTPGQDLAGEVNVGYANYNTISGNIYLGGGVTDKLVADIAVQVSRQNDGWGTNSFNGKDVYGVDHDIAVRSKWVFTPTDTSKFTLIGDYSSRTDSDAAYRVFPNTVSGFSALPGYPPLGPFPSIGYNTNTDTQPETETSGGGVSFRWEQDIDDLKFMSLSAFRSSEARFIFDYDGSSQPIEGINAVQRDRQFSEELQLSSGAGGPLKWVVGAYYFEGLSQYAPFILTANDLGADVTVRNKQLTEAGAGFAQGTYEIFDRTNLTLGGRYSIEKREVFDGETGVFVIPLDLTLPPTLAPGKEATFYKFTFRGSLDHRFSDSVLAYVSFNRGFKSGGFNTSEPGSDPFHPETLDATELGVKTDFLNRRLRLNVAGYYYNYQDLQIQQLNAGAITIINGAAAEIYGGEADLKALVTEELQLNASVSLSSPTFSSFPKCPISTPAGGTPVTYGSCQGNLLPLSSHAAFSVGANYEMELPDGLLDLNGNLYFNSGFDPESDNIITQDAFAELGVQAKYTLNNGVSFALFGKNLTDEKVISFETTLPNGTHTGYYAAPRTFGFTAGYKF